MAKLLPYDGPLNFHLGYVMEILRLAVGVMVGTGPEMTQEPHVYYDGVVGHDSGRETCD